MVSGRTGGDVGRAIEAAAAQVRRQVDAQVASMRELDARVTELVDRRGKSLLELARHYLPAISAETVAGSFAEVQDDLARILADKARKESELQSLAAAAQTEAARQDAELHRVTGLLNDKVTEREKLEAIVAERLHGSDEFKRLSEQALAAEQQLRKNEERVAETKQESAKKLPSYDKSRLFRYLYDAGYGTPAYGGTGFTKTMDRWVARLIDYNSARQGYDFLRTTPELMVQEVSRRRDAFNGLMEKVEAIEDHVGDEVGLTAVMREGQELGAQRDKQVDVAAKVQDELRKRQQALLQLAGTQNEFYEHAIARMQNFLANVPPQELEAHSRQTPEREDDAIVAEVRYLNDQLAETQRNGTAVDQDRAAWNARLAGLQQIVQQFRSSEFDSQRSVFPSDFDVEGMLAEMTAGRQTAAQVWSAIQQSQRFAPMGHDQPYHEAPGMPGMPGGPWRGGSRPTFGDVISSDASLVLLRVLGDIAGAAMRQSAQRGVQRRAPMRQQNREAAGRPTHPNRGFTNGRGF